jgi:hypothetical protein
MFSSVIAMIKGILFFLEAVNQKSYGEKFAQNYEIFRKISVLLRFYQIG